MPGLWYARVPAQLWCSRWSPPEPRPAHYTLSYILNFSLPSFPLNPTNMLKSLLHVFSSFSPDSLIPKCPPCIGQDGLGFGAETINHCGYDNPGCFSFVLRPSESPGVLLTVVGPKRMEVLSWPTLQWFLWREKRVWERPAPYLLIFSRSSWHTSDFSHDSLLFYSLPLFYDLCSFSALSCSYSVKITPWPSSNKYFLCWQFIPNCSFQYHFCVNDFQIFIFSSATLCQQRLAFFHY